jgi:hypothetical protein
MKIKKNYCTDAINRVSATPINRITKGAKFCAPTGDMYHDVCIGDIVGAERRNHVKLCGGCRNSDVQCALGQERSRHAFGVA